MFTPPIRLGGFYPFMPIFIGGQMSGRAYVRTLLYSTKNVFKFGGANNYFNFYCVSNKAFVSLYLVAMTL